MILPRSRSTVHHHHHPFASAMPLLRDLIVTLTLTLTLGGETGSVSGWPLFRLSRGGPLRARDDGTPLEDTADGLSGRLGRLVAQLRSQEAQITDMGTQLAKVTHSILFTVTFSGYDVDDLGGKGQTLRFDKVLANAGGGYDPSTGIFKAPADGLYAFHFQVSRHPSDSTSCVELELLHSHLAGKLSQSASIKPHQSSVLPARRYQQQQQQQQQSSSSIHYKQQQQQQQQQEQTVAVVSACGPGSRTSSNRTVVRLVRGDTVRVRTMSGNMLGDGFSSLSGLRLPALSPFHGTLLR